MPNTKRQERGEQALRELLGDELIFLSRAPLADELHDLYVSGVDPARALRLNEVEAIIAGSEWRTIPLGWARGSRPCRRMPEGLPMLTRSGPEG